MSDIQKIKIFLASSSELKDDREQFEIFINRQNKQYIEKNIFLYLVLWEDFIDAMSPNRLQDEYNKAIEECDIFVSLFQTKVGQYTEEEFTTAFKTFQESKKPQIYTYFKNSLINLNNITPEINTLLTFKQKLKQLGHFLTQYNNIDDLKHQFGNQLTKIIKNLTDTPTEQQIEDIEGIPCEAKELYRDLQNIYSTSQLHFKSELIKKIISEASREINNINSDYYNIDVGTEKNFLVRAKSIFENAIKIYAFSVDKISTFWDDQNNRGLAREYLNSQPKNTIRMFVFSSAEEANKYVNILQANHKKYGEEGRVYICSRDSYRNFINQFGYSGDISEYFSQDFGILYYEDKIIIEATLNKSHLKFQFIDLNQPKKIDYNSLISKLEELKNLDYEGFYDEQSEKSFCIKRWNPECVNNSFVWKDELTKLFPSPQTGKAYHCVFFKDPEQRLEQSILTIKNEIDFRSKPLGIKTIWFGKKPEIRPLHDANTRGILKINRDYDYLLLMEFESIGEMEQYYEKANHSTIRSDLYKKMDDGLKVMYKYLESNEENKSLIFENIIEEIASKYMVRCDFLNIENVDTIVQQKRFRFND